MKQPAPRKLKPLQEIMREHAEELEVLGRKDRQLDQVNIGGNKPRKSK